MWQFYPHGRDDGQEDEGLAELIFLGISRCALLKPWEACGALTYFIGLVRAEAEHVGQPECKLQDARNSVELLTTAPETFPDPRAESESPSASLAGPAGEPSSPATPQGSPPVQLGQVRQSQPSPAACGLHRQEEAAEREWAVQHSFQKIFGGMAPGVKFAQFVRHGATTLQTALQAMHFDGGFDNIGLPHSQQDLVKLADRAQTALESCDPNAYGKRDGAGDAEHGDGGRSDTSDTDRAERQPNKRRRNGGRDSRSGGDGNAGCTGRAQAHAVRMSIWRPDEDGTALELLSDEETRTERHNRTAARDALLEYHKALEQYLELQRQGGEAEAVAAEPPPRPRLISPRLFINGKWERRGYVTEMNINGWRTAHLKGQPAQAARAKQTSTIVKGKEDRGNKRVEGRSFYIRRSDPDGEGLCLFAGKALPKGTVVGPYVGRLIRAEVLQRHRDGDQVGGHFVSLRNKASMPETQNVIDGAIMSQPVDGKRYGLEYFLRNGPSSMANCGTPAQCNSKFMVEYERYDRPGPALYIDDEYCPEQIPPLQRVKSTA